MIGWMTMMNNKILTYLDEMFPNPKCELEYNKDYELLIAVVLSAQTTDKKVNSVTTRLFQEYPTLHDLKQASVEEIHSIIRATGFKRKALFVKEIATILDDEYQGVVPQNREKLESLPGVGRKTANVVLSELFDIPAIAVDTHVERVSKRLGIAKSKDSVLTVEKKIMKAFPKEKWGKLHLQLVHFGRYKCKAINPQCLDCKLKELCKNRR